MIAKMKKGLPIKFPQKISLPFLVRAEGFEPPTKWLRATCSTAELCAQKDVVYNRECIDSRQEFRYNLRQIMRL